MTDLWGFLLQTAYVSLVGLLVAAVKWMLGEKLSPSWRYVVWGVLAARLVVPAGWGRRAALLPLPLWTETLRLLGDGARLEAAETVRVLAPVPWLTGLPRSWSDWLFAVYAAGVLAVLLHALLRWLLRRRQVTQGHPPSEELRQQVAAVGERYHLPLCRLAVLPGCAAPFVFGVVRPVLVLPKEGEAEDLAILRELVRLRHHAVFQQGFWSFWRAVHWCNPWVRLLLNRAQEDLETLCDRRVLALLPEHDRQAYGISLRSAFQPDGTPLPARVRQSIARRIQAAAHFQPDPKGRGLVSVCVTVVLLAGCLAGPGQTPVLLSRGGTWGRTQALAAARLHRCTTVAEAVDTYAKGLVEGNRLFLLSAASDGVRLGLSEEYRIQGETFSLLQDKDLPFRTVLTGQGGQTAEGSGTVRCAFTGEAYRLCALREEGRNTCSALLVLPVEEERHDALPRPGVLVCSVRIFRERGGYVVEETAERTLYLSDRPGWFYTREDGYPFLPADKCFRGEGETGSGEVLLQVLYGWEEDRAMVRSPQSDVEELPAWGAVTVRYTCRPDQRQQGQTLGLQAVETARGEEPDFSRIDTFAYLRPGAAGGTGRACWAAMTPPADWDGTASCSTGRSLSEGAPEAFALRVLWNGTVRETLRLEEVDPDETA